MGQPVAAFFVALITGFIRCKMEQETEYRLSTLETVLAEFIMQTNRSLNRMERDTANFKVEQQRRDEENKVEIRRDQETHRKEVSKQIRDMNQKWGEVTEKLGTFAEDLAAPNLKRIAREQFGCKEPDYYSVRIDKRNPLNHSQMFEFDAILIAGQTVFLLESKFTVRMKYLEGLPRLIENFKLCFPEYDSYKLIPVFASMSIQPDQVKYLTNQGIYAMALGEENMELLNFNELQSR